tara:strand:- start:349 stop:1188 length:840 start_codon:yes stop_codon:yes gene_type:complete
MARKHYKENFGSIAELVKAATHTWSARPPLSRGEESRAAGTTWNGGGTFEEAVDLITYGWSEGAEKIVKGIRALEQGFSTRKNAYSIAGGRPKISRVISGRPDCMVRRGKRKGRKKVIRLGVNLSANYKVRARDIQNFGIGLLTVVNSLETQGFSVELTAYEKSAKMGDTITIATRIKNAGDALDVDRAAFVLSHPAFLRRLMFAIIESKVEYDAFTKNGGYGSASSVTQGDVDADEYIIAGLTNRTNLNTPKDAARHMVGLVNKLLGRDVLDLTGLED